MFATIRRFTPTAAGSMTKDAIQELRRQIDHDFLPVVQKIDGFHGYYALTVGEKELVTVSLFETEKGATESNRSSAEFVKKTPLPFQVSKPEISEGEVLAFAEAGRMAGAH
jgi:hypothetical protein